MNSIAEKILRNAESRSKEAAEAAAFDESAMDPWVG